MLYLFLWLWGKGRACLGRGFVSAAFAVQKFIDEVTFAGIRVLISESHAFHYVLIDGEKNLRTRNSFKSGSKIKIFFLPFVLKSPLILDLGTFLRHLQ